jgi:hypothetical protein
MKKLTFLFGAAVGFLLGSKVGHEPYAQVESKVKELAGRPEVQDAMEKAKGAAQEQVDHVAEKVNDKLPSSGSSTPSGSSSRSSNYARTSA